MLGAYDVPKRRANHRGINDRASGDECAVRDDADEPVVAGRPRESGAGWCHDIDPLVRRRLSHRPIHDEQATRGDGASIARERGPGQGDHRIGAIHDGRSDRTVPDDDRAGRRTGFR